MREHLLFWLLVYSKVLLGLPRCHILVPGNVGPLVVGVGLCTRQLNVLWHSECVLVRACTEPEGNQLSPWIIVYILVNLDSVSLAVYGVLGLPFQYLGHCSWTTVGPPVTV